MKKFILFSLIIPVLSLVIFKDQIIISIARKNIQKALPHSKASIEKIEFHPFSSLRFKGVKIRYPLKSDYLSFEGIFINYALASLFRGEIKKVEVTGMDISLQELIKVSAGSPVFNVREIAASGSLKFKDLEVRNMKAEVKRLDNNELQVNFNAGAAGIKKINLSNLGAVIEASEKADAVNCRELTFSVFGGKINGGAVASITKSGLSYELDMVGEDIDLKNLTEELELKDRFEATGRCSLKLKAKGENKNLPQVNAELATQEGGGKFNIKDKQALGSLGVADQLSLDLVLESLKNYQYDNGRADIYTEEGNILAHILMDGAQGARDLTVIFHVKAGATLQ